MDLFKELLGVCEGLLVVVVVVVEVVEADG